MVGNRSLVAERGAMFVSVGWVRMLLGMVGWLEVATGGSNVV